MRVLLDYNNTVRNIHISTWLHVSATYYSHIQEFPAIFGLTMNLSIARVHANKTCLLTYVVSEEFTSRDVGWTGNQGAHKQYQPVVMHSCLLLVDL